MARGRLTLCLLSLVLCCGAAFGLELPKMTKERQQAVDALMRASVKAGAIEVPAQGPVRIDDKKLRCVVADMRDQVNAELVDALVAFWVAVETRREPVAVAFLRACGQEKQDERSMGFAAFLSGVMAQRQPAEWKDATTRYSEAVKHFARAKEPAWEIATLNNLAVLQQAQGEYAKAEQHLGRALEMAEELYPKPRFPAGHPTLAQSLNNLGVLHQAQGEYTKADLLFNRVQEMNERLYPKTQFPQGHPHLARSLNNQAAVPKAQGDYARAEVLLSRALLMREALHPPDHFPQGHPELANSLNNLASLHLEQGELAKAEQLFRRALEMNETLYPETRYPDGHPLLASSLNNLAYLHKAQGEYAKAEQHFRRALGMNETLYPRTRYPHGHPALAHSITNLAWLYRDKGDHDKAESLYRRALEMREALYPRKQVPQGNLQLAQSLNNLALLLQARGDDTKAEPLLRRVLDMCEGLFPRTRFPHGHPQLATSINNLASLHQNQGEFAKAELLFRRVLTMREGLYAKARFPHGHPDLALSLTNLASLHLAQGETAKAEPLFRRALAMHTISAVTLAASSTEATALNYLASIPRSRDGFLNSARDLPSAEIYSVIWQTKAALSRVFEGRHLAALAAINPQARQLASEIRSLRGDRERVLLAPLEANTLAVRTKRLDDIEEEIRKKELALVPLTATSQRSQEIANANPAELRKVLLPDVAMVDIVRYVRSEVNRKIKGSKGKQETPRYTAFVLTRDGVQRVELQSANEIDDLLHLWRRAMADDSPAEPDYAARVHERVWKPLMPYLPRKCSLVYVGPEGPLHTMPWSALRDPKTGRRLIEDHAVAVVPHGPMLLDRLTKKNCTKRAAETLLAMGGVDYDKATSAGGELPLRSPSVGSVVWSALPATRKEMNHIVRLASDKKVLRREERDGSTANLLSDLPKAHIAHLATHGFFADKKFRNVLHLDEKLFLGSEFVSGGTAQRIGAGTRSPLVLSGLVCAGANANDTPNRGILTAEAIVGLDLRKMDLAVLSACETGLGDVAGGEGVYGLTRAFHVAGCRNVVASLWKVEDEATAALMVLFYRQMWGKEPVPPAEALRRAQLALYREPGRIPEWSQGRGPLPRLVGVPKEPENGAPRPWTSATRSWAGFVLSGPG